MSSVKLPRMSQSKIDQCPIHDRDGKQCILMASHWPWAHMNHLGRKWMIIRGDVAYNDLDFCQAATPNGDPCTLPIGHEGTHHYDSHNFEEAYTRPNEPDSKPAPQPIKKLHITSTDPLLGLVILECIPEVAAVIERARFGRFSGRGLTPNGYQLEVSTTLFDFGGVVDWLNTLA